MVMTHITSYIRLLYTFTIFTDLKDGMLLFSGCLSKILIYIKWWVWISHNLKAASETGGSVFFNVCPSLPIKGVIFFKLLHVIKFFSG